MSIQFPSPASQGDTFTASNGVIYTYDNGGWTANSVSGLDASYVNRSGDTMTGDLTVPSLNGGPLAGLRNQLINGGFDCWQRNTDNNTASTTQLYVSADRWAVKHSDSTGKGLGRVVNPYADAPCSYAGEFRALNSTNVSRIFIEQCIELADGTNGQFANRSQWTLSYYGDAAVNFTLYFSNGINDISATSVASGTTVLGAGNKYSATVTINGNSSTGQNCLRVAMAPTGTTATEFTMTGVQLEPGPVATPFEQRPIGLELNLCKRYYFAFNTTYAGGKNYAPGGTADLTVFNYVACPEFRAVPTVTLTRTGELSGLAAEPTLAAASVTGYYIKGNKNGGSGRFNWEGTITADAEL